MTKELYFGIQTNGIKHRHADPMPDIDTRFSMVKATGLFDYVDKTPAPDEVEAFEKASQKYDLPIRGGGWFYTIGEYKPLLEHNLAVAKRLGSTVHNVQILANDSTGKPVSNNDVVDAYLWAYDIGLQAGVTPCFEVHVNMWSEDFRRVAIVAKAVEAHGIPFCMTLDHSHVVFKINHPDEQEIQNIRPAVESGELVLDPFTDGNVVDQWINAGWVRHCHARSAVPNNPRNTAATDDHGQPGRGIQYPFAQPARGEYHAPWDEQALEPWKESVRHLLAFHANDPQSRLGQISTEFIPNLDYGEGCKYSLFEQAIECVHWMRNEWGAYQQS
ncbi:MAG: xylose isomerase [Burkholderiaceae bacterium]